MFFLRALLFFALATVSLVAGDPIPNSPGSIRLVEADPDYLKRGEWTRVSRVDPQSTSVSRFLLFFFFWIMLMWIYTSQHKPLKIRFEINGSKLMVQFKQARGHETDAETPRYPVSQITAAASKKIHRYYYYKIMDNSDWIRPAESQEEAKVYCRIKSIGLSHTV